MKKHIITVLLLVLTGLAACTTSPETKKVKPAVSKAEIHYRKALKMFNNRNYFDAVPAFEELKEKFPISPFATLAELRLGDSHLLQKEYELAIHYYDNFKRLHPNHKDVPYSIYMTGLCHFEQMLSVDRDQTAALEAVEYFQSLVDLYPESPYTGKALCRISEAKKRIAGHEIMVGLFYLQNEQYKGAAKRFIHVLKKYPQNIEKPKIYYHIAQTDFATGNLRRGSRIVALLSKKYPESDYTARAKELSGGTPEKEAEKKK